MKSSKYVHIHLYFVSWHQWGLMRLKKQTIRYNGAGEGGAKQYCCTSGYATQVGTLRYLPSQPISRDILSSDSNPVLKTQPLTYPSPSPSTSPRSPFSEGSTHYLPLMERIIISITCPWARQGARHPYRRYWRRESYCSLLKGGRSGYAVCFWYLLVDGGVHASKRGRIGMKWHTLLTKGKG